MNDGWTDGKWLEVLQGPMGRWMIRWISILKRQVMSISAAEATPAPMPLKELTTL